MPGEGLRADRADGRHLDPLGIVALLLQERLRLTHDPRRPLAAVGQVGALVTVGRDEDPVEPRSMACAIQAGLIPLVQGRLMTSTPGE